MEFRSDGLIQYYTDSGAPKSSDKKPAGTLVLIHGFPHTHQLWDRQVSGLSAHHRVVTYDMRGSGKSEGGDGTLLMDFLADDLFALLDHLRVEKADIAGLSMGGYVALQAIHRSPERFRSLLLCDTASAADTNTAKQKRADQIRHVRKDGMLKFVDAYSDGVFPPETLKKNPGLLQDFRSMVLQNRSDSVIDGLVAMSARPDHTETLSKIGIPCLVLVGEKDTVTPPETAKTMANAIPNAQFEIIPGAGHLSNFEAPEVFNQIVHRFLATLE